MMPETLRASNHIVVLKQLKKESRHKDLGVCTQTFSRQQKFHTLTNVVRLPRPLKWIRLLLPLGISDKKQTLVCIITYANDK
jgi:hypothetical protein